MYTSLALLLLLAQSSLAQCPTSCKCPPTEDSLIIEARCTNASLTEVPTGQLEEAIFVDLSHNNITTLRDDAFKEKGVLKLARLYLGNNGLRTIEDRAFRGLTQLKLLGLETNDIRAIPPNLFEDNSQLEVLNLNRNPSLRLPDSGLDIPSLDILSLKNCGLKEISARFFARMTNLHHVFLNGNELSALAEQAIRALVHLKTLNLSINKFTTLPFDLHYTFPESLRINVFANPLHCHCGLQSVYDLNEIKKLYTSITCDHQTEPLSTFLLDSCNSTVETTSPPVPLLKGTTTPLSTLRVVVPEDPRLPKSDRDGATLDVERYSGWIALSAVLLAFVVIGFIVVVIRRRHKEKDYAIPRTFTLLTCDDDDDKSYVA